MTRSLEFWRRLCYFWSGRDYVQHEDRSMTIGDDRKTGKPKPETLKRLGLDWLARDLWGIEP